MNELQILGLNSFIAFAYLAGIWVLFFWLYREYRIDLFRQRVFGIRDELFDLALAGHLPFDHPTYGIMRTILNGYIRFAHRMSLAGVIVITWEMSRLPAARPRLFDTLEQSLAELPPTTQHQLRDLMSRLHIVTLDQLVLSSASTWLLLFPVVLLAVMRAVGQRATRWVARQPVWRFVRSTVVEGLDSEALVIGT